MTTASTRRAQPMTALETLAEINRVAERLRGLDESLQHAMSDPGSEAAPRLQREIAAAVLRKERLLEQLLQMDQAAMAELIGERPGA